MNIEQEFKAYRAIASEQRLLSDLLKGPVGRAITVLFSEIVSPFLYIMERTVVGTQSQKIIDGIKREIDLSRKVF